MRRNKKALLEPASSHDYTLTIDLNALSHLGINLYSNVPAVISETVANAWDADAETVWIDVDRDANSLTITDDGVGMTEDEINNKYLRVGYDKRKNDGSITPKFKRHVMGRKGIGKLSLFSIAKTIQVHSVKRDRAGKVIERNAFRMNSDDIKKVIGSEKKDYKPIALSDSVVTIDRGTRLIITDFKSDNAPKTAWIRKRLARRFSVIGEEFDFTVDVDGKPITVEDRDYLKSIQYIWCIGEGAEEYAKAATNAKKVEYLDGVIDQHGKFKVSGWIGTFDEQRNIDEERENNAIVVLAWGKLVQEDMLSEIDEAGLFTKYLIGEIHADWVDDDKQEDIATSDRQHLKADDPRYKTLRAYVEDVVKKTIKLKWGDWRKEGATERALKNAVVQEWYEQLTIDNKKYARDVFERIERAYVPDEGLRRELYKQSILAFESFAYRENLSALDGIGPGDEFQRFVAAFATMDQLEEAYYYTIAKSRVEVLTKFEKLSSPKTKEKTLQEHIFNHLWLLDPSWERASVDARMEVQVEKEWKKVNATLGPDERKARIDIKYRTAAGKHIIIELKKYDRKVDATDLVRQVRKYRSALRKIVMKTEPGREPWIETICILGSEPLPYDDPLTNEKLLLSVDARYITYDQLIQRTRESYGDYLKAKTDIGRIRELIARL